MEVQSVFDFELTALAIARVASTTSSEQCTIHSDSQASLTVMENINARQYQKKALQHAVNQPHLYSDCKCLWVQSHVEKRKDDRKLWTLEEKGNYIADMMAEHDQKSLIAGPKVTVMLDRLISITTVMVVKLSTVIGSFMTHNSFSLRMNNQRYLGNLKDLHITDQCKNYLVTRDTYRAKRRIGAPPKPFWSCKLPNLLVHTNRASKTLRENSFRSRIIYNKSWTTENQYKYGVTDTPEHCPCCGNGLETQKHILFRCSHKVMRKARRLVTKVINHLILKQITRKKTKRLAPIIEYLRESAFSRKSTALWTGLWSNSLYNTINAKLKGYPYNEEFPITTVLKLSRIYTDATKELYIIRHAIKQNLTITVSEAHTEGIQTRITDYFTADNTEKPKKDKSKDKRPASNTPVPTTPGTKVTTIDDMCQVQHIDDIVSTNNAVSKGCPVTHINENYTIRPTYQKRAATPTANLSVVALAKKTKSTNPPCRPVAASRPKRATKRSFQKPVDEHHDEYHWNDVTTSISQKSLLPLPPVTKRMKRLLPNADMGHQRPTPKFVSRSPHNNETPGPIDTTIAPHPNGGIAHNDATTMDEGQVPEPQWPREGVG
jgi:hypothetical protein